MEVSVSTDLAPQQQQPIQRAEKLIVHDDSELSYLLDTARYEHLYRIATMMDHASIVPKHLKGESADEGRANCFMVLNQALRFKIDPFALAQMTYVVGGKLAYEGKFVAAMVNTRAGLISPLSYSFDGAGENRTITVSGAFARDGEVRTVTVCVKDAKTSNKIWQTDPDQKLVYNGAIKWARRHCPEVIAGILIDDDLDRIVEADVSNTPTNAPRISKADSMLSRMGGDDGKTLDVGTADKPKAEAWQLDLATKIARAASFGAESFKKVEDELLGPDSMLTEEHIKWVQDNIGPYRDKVVASDQAPKTKGKHGELLK
jgi:hypothetical protein